MIKNIHFASALALFAAAACSPSTETSTTAGPEDATVTQEAFAIIIAGTNVGALTVDHDGDTAVIDYDFKNNGRGPTIAETIQFDDRGIPVSWSVSGSTTFGNQIEETYTLSGNEASWTDATGSDSATVDGATLAKLSALIPAIVLPCPYNRHW